MAVPTLADLRDVASVPADHEDETVDQYYHAWALLDILWRTLWVASRTDWSAYRLRIWDIFTSNVRSAARTGYGVDGFLTSMAESMNLIEIGTDADERMFVASLLALTGEPRRRLLFQLRHKLPVLMLFLRQYRDRRRDELEARNRGDNIQEGSA